jgi:hypothetical protein
MTDRTEAMRSENAGLDRPAQGGTE